MSTNSRCTFHQGRTRDRTRAWVALTAFALVVTLGACDDSLQPEQPAAEMEPQAQTLAAFVQPESVQSATLPVGPTAIPAAAQCPPLSFVTGVNLAVNPSFERGGTSQTWPPGTGQSAATGWWMHSSNDSATVISSRVATTVPGPGGLKMLAFKAGGNEGGVYQIINNAPRKVMFSVWVKVMSGKVVIGANGMVNQTPYSWSTKIGEWEQLRVCTDGTYDTGYFFIVQNLPMGGFFYADRVEIKEIP
jgi:hypothetical protein